MDIFGILFSLAIVAGSVVLFRRWSRNRALGRDNALTAFLPILDGHIQHVMVLIERERVDYQVARSEALERGIDPRMMYVLNEAETLLAEHGHEVEFDEIALRAQGLFERLRANPQSSLHREPPDA